MGTSLAVQPFASMVDNVGAECPRVLINMEKVGAAGTDLARLISGRGLMFDSPGNYRDVAILGSCDDGCWSLSEKLGWKDDLQSIINRK